MKKSKVYALYGKKFRYDFDNAVVEYIAKADPEMLEDNREWQEKYGKNLWDIDEDGYMVIDSAGLMNKNWKNKAARDEYLAEWSYELDVEAELLKKNFEEFELPLLKKEGVVL